MNLSKTFVEKRRIENIIFKVSPKERFTIEEFVKEMGIKNVSEWYRDIIFKNIDNGIKINKLEIN